MGITYPQPGSPSVSVTGAGTDPHNQVAAYGTAAEWTAAAVVLAVGEIGYETDTKVHKIGDGATAWSSLAATGSSTYGQFQALAANSLLTLPRPAYTWLYTFQAGAVWSAYGGSQASHNFNDTSDGFTGPQCSSIITTGVGGSGAIIEKTSISPVIDLTGKSLVVAVKYDDWTRIGNLQVYASSDAATYTNAYQWTVSQSGTTGKIGMFDSNEWVAITLSFADAITLGAPTRSSIQAIRLLSSDKNTGALTAYYGGVGTVPEPSTTWPNGVISLSFDDSYATQWSIAAPKLSQHGYRGTLFPIVSNLGTGGCLTLAQVQALHDNLGWEVGAHASSTITHPTTGLSTFSAADIDIEMRTLRAWQQTYGFEADTWASPGGYNSALIDGIVGQYYSTVRAGYGNLRETWPPARRTRVRTVDARAAAYNLSQIEAEVDKCKNNKTWLILTMHDFATSSPTGVQMQTSVFQSLVDYIATQGVPVLPIREAARAYKAPA